LKIIFRFPKVSKDSLDIPSKSGIEELNLLVNTIAKGVDGRELLDVLAHILSYLFLNFRRMENAGVRLSDQWNPCED